MWSLQAHYTLDMISGMVFAHYFWIIGDKYSYLVDWKLFRIPLTKRIGYFNPNITKNEIQN
jgi:hypothetical protein